MRSKPNNDKFRPVLPRITLYINDFVGGGCMRVCNLFAGECVEKLRSIKGARGVGVYKHADFTIYKLG